MTSLKQKLLSTKITRDSALFLVGLLLTIYEALLQNGEPRVELLMVYCGMMGLPVFLHSDEKKNKTSAGADKES